MKTLLEYLETDQEFARELITSLSDNLTEFRDSLLQAIKLRDSEIFLSSYHKMKTTLGYTQNEKLKLQADMIKSMMLQQGVESIDVRVRNTFCGLCDSSSFELQKQLKYYLKMEI